VKKLTLLGLFCSLATFTNGYAADIEAGKETAAICAGCHGVDGQAMNPEWPNLAGQNAKYIEIQLRSFQNGNRKNDMMTPMAQSLNAESVANVAAYYNSLK